MQHCFFYDFINYRVHDRLGDDGLTQWHPPFFSLGKILDECAEKYPGFCKRYKPKPRPEKCIHWGGKLLGRSQDYRYPKPENHFTSWKIPRSRESQNSVSLYATVSHPPSPVFMREIREKRPSSI